MVEITPLDYRAQNSLKNLLHIIAFDIERDFRELSALIIHFFLELGVTLKRIKILLNEKIPVTIFIKYRLFSNHQLFINH